MEWRRVDLAICDSTNDEALALARQGAPHGTVVIANQQRAGRGREGRVWQSPPGAGLYMSIVLRPRLPLAEVPPLTLAIGIAVCDAARAHGAAAQLKWPNDVLVGTRKLAGVLVEAQSQGGVLESAIAGIGVNLTGELPPELHAVSLGADGIDREAFIATLLAQLALRLDNYAGVPVADWTARMAPDLPARAGAIVGVCAGIAADGALLLRDASGSAHRVRSGEVEILRKPVS